MHPPVEFNVPLWGSGPPELQDGTDLAPARESHLMKLRGPPCAGADSAEWGRDTKQHRNEILIVYTNVLG